MSYSDTLLVTGVDYLAVVELPFRDPGNYRIVATDLKWFDLPLQALSFGAFTATGPILVRQGAGALEFFKAGGERVFVQIYARPAAPRFAGLVTLQADVSDAVVPLPASIWLLASSLAGLASLRRGRGSARPALAAPRACAPV